MDGNLENLDLRCYLLIEVMLIIFMTGLGNMVCGKDIQSCILMKISFTRLVLVIIRRIGSLLMFLGTLLFSILPLKVSSLT